jgi:hypothetical protein
MRTRNGRDGRTDEGSALLLVLVLMVVGALIVLPLMDYAMSTGRANTVLSTKTARTEAVKAGLRIAMADSTRLYSRCGPPLGGANTFVVLSATGVDVPVTTKCYFIDQALSLDPTEVRHGLAAVQVGQTVPAGLLSAGYVSPNPTSTSAWIADTTLTSLTDKVWLPDLPSHGLSPRSPLGWQMPPEFLPVGVTDCTVYFPGTYPNAVTLDGPTYFTSGIYYFEDTVLITGGADVVVGEGEFEGCVNDQYAAFYAIGAPSTHNINGLGATFVFGKAGRLVVANDVGPAIKVRFNKRYVALNDPGVAPSAGVSILSVNGKLAADGVTGVPLLIPNVLEVPLSHVGVVTAPTPPVSATTQGYLPSTLVPSAVATVPDPPTSLVTAAWANSIQVSWTAPLNNGGSQIKAYTVRVASGLPNTSTCTTISATMCVVSGLTPLTPYTFTVEATNDVGISAPSAASSAMQTGTNPPPASPPGALLPPLPPQTPIIDFALTTGTLVDVRVPGYISIPQGRIRVSNPSGHPVILNGGVLVASFDVTDSRPAPQPIGLENTMAQGTFKLVTETTSGSPHMVSSAIVQINQGGGWAINTWEVQSF